MSNMKTLTDSVPNWKDACGAPLVDFFTIITVSIN